MPSQAIQDMNFDERWDSMNPEPLGTSHGKRVCHGMWVDGKLIPPQDEHLYIDDDGNWLDKEDTNVRDSLDFSNGVVPVSRFDFD